MNRLRFENSVKSKLAAAIESDSQTEIAIEGPELFPVLEEGDFYFVTVVEGSAPNEVVEVMKVTGQSGELLTVARGQDGTDARSFNVTARIEMRVNAGIMRHLIDERLALEARTIEADAVLQANIDEQAANVGGATAQIVSSAIRTLLVDETQAITAGSSVVFSHIADPALLRSIFVEKYVDGQTTPVVLEGADGPILAAGETELPMSVGLSVVESITQAAINGVGATTAISFDGGATYSAFSNNHGTVIVPEGATTLKVKASLGEVPDLLSRGTTQIVGADGVIGAWTANWNALCSVTLEEGMHFEFETLSIGQGWIGVADGIVTGYRGGGSVLAGGWNHWFGNILTTGDIATIDIVGTSAVCKLNGVVSKTMDFSAYADPCVFVMSEVANRFKIIQSIPSFTSVTFDKTDRPSWLIDNDSHWSAELASATVTTLTNISSEDKNARIRIGATGFLRYGFDKALTPGGSALLQLPVSHGGQASIRMKQFKDSTSLTDNRWDFDVQDSDNWSGGRFTDGMIGLPEAAAAVLATGVRAAAEVFAWDYGAANAGFNPFGFWKGQLSDASGGLMLEIPPNNFIYLDAGVGKTFVVGDMQVCGYGIVGLGTGPFTVDVSDDFKEWTRVGELTDHIDTVYDATHHTVVPMNGSGRHIRIAITAARRYDGVTGNIMMGNSNNTYSVPAPWDLDIIEVTYDPSAIVQSVSSIPTSFADTLNSIAVTDNKPTGTDVRYALSFDGKATWKTNGNAVLSENEIPTSGMTTEELAAFDFSGVSIGDTLDVAIGMSTSNLSASPSVDHISLSMTTRGAYMYTSINPETIMMFDEGDTAIRVVNNLDTDQTLKIIVEV